MSLKDRFCKSLQEMSHVKRFNASYLTAALTAMRKARDGDATSAISYIDTLWVLSQRERNTEFPDRVEVKLILLVAIEREEDM